SGKDTTLTGAQASGDTVNMNVGGDLTLSSQQVTDKYDSKQTNSSVGGSYSQGGGISANISADKSEMHSDYQSVDNQTGIHAGQGGFDITVGDHTQLDGAAISSDASKDKNRLDTGTIGFNDIENKADYKVEQQSGGYNTGGDIGGKLISNAGSALLAGVNNKGKDSNTTHSAVAEGDIIVRDTENQTQNVDDLSRDTANAHEKLGTIFDKDEEQKRIDRNQLIGEIGQQIKDIAVMDARINATQNVLKNNPELKGDDLEAAIQAEINQSKWGVGGENTRIVDAGTALIQGLANGDVNAAVANASAPYIANIIAKEIGKDNKAGLLAAHAIANVALALAKDENALSQAAGAVTAEAMGMLSQELYKKDVSQLTEEEKSTLSAFASLAAGIAGGLVGGETQDALNAAQAGKNTVENNSLSGTIAKESGKKAITLCAQNPGCRNAVTGTLGLSTAFILTKEQIEEATNAGISRDPSKIANLSVDQILWLDSQILAGGMGDLMFGTQTWGDRIELQPHTGGNQLPEQGRTDTGGNQIPEQERTDTGGNQIVEPGRTDTGGNQIPEPIEKLPGTPIPETPSLDDLAYLDKITQGEHAGIRNKEGRPVSSVINDVQKSRPADILIQDDGRWVVKGNGGRIHIIEPDGEVVTSFDNPANNTNRRIKDGTWNRPSNEQLNEFKDKFSDYVRW
ncbi:VENN motif pre-toxin domain-containing protein, partial [Providencia rettgeri]